MRRTQEDRSAATKAALVTAARELFARRGYAAVPADEIVRAAGVTRGALYHHYGDKQGLFRAVFEQLEAELEADIRSVMRGASDIGSVLVVALAEFLDACARRDVRQIGLMDAPAVLGWETWRQIEAEHGLGLIADALSEAMEQGLVLQLPVDVLSRLLLSAVIEAALLIANADDPATARTQAEQVLVTWFGSLLAQQPG